jgi:hypothetical protein
MCLLCWKGGIEQRRDTNFGFEKQSWLKRIQLFESDRTCFVEIA